jgi:hypothetical protein
MEQSSRSFRCYGFRVCALSFLQQYSARGQKFLAAIATEHDMCVPTTLWKQNVPQKNEKPLVPKNKKFKTVKSYDEVIFTMFGEYKCGLFTHIKQKGATTNTTACHSAMDHFKRGHSM